MYDFKIIKDICPLLLKMILKKLWIIRALSLLHVGDLYNRKANTWAYSVHERVVNDSAGSRSVNSQWHARNKKQAIASLRILERGRKWRWWSLLKPVWKSTWSNESFRSHIHSLATFPAATQVQNQRVQDWKTKHRGGGEAVPENWRNFICIKIQWNLQNPCLDSVW